MTNEIKMMKKKHNRSQYELALHECAKHPNYRCAIITVEEEQLKDLLLKAHIASNRLVSELNGDHLRRFKLRVVLTLKGNDEILINETQLYWIEQLEFALEEITELYEGHRIEYIFGVDPKAEDRYKLSIMAEYEQPQISID